MKTAVVNVSGGSYEIRIGHGIKKKAPLFILDSLGNRRLAIITDRHVAKLWLNDFYRIFKEGGLQSKICVVPAGEKSKTLKWYRFLAEKLLYFGADRDWAIVAFGGGVVGDLGGFVAATYQRGIPFVQVPTTLLACVDSSIGGKVAIDLGRAKNALGAFYQPKGVFIDTLYLSTLPFKEYRAGLVEALKYGIIQDQEFFNFFEDHAEEINELKSSILEYIVLKSIEHKRKIVELDEKEGSIRSILNFGHTFGHAFEVLTGYKRYLHGEAVALGMVVEAYVAKLLGYTKGDEHLRIAGVLQKLGLSMDVPKFKPYRLEDVIKYDKKKRGEIIRFVVLDEIGSVRIEPIEIKRLIEAWNAVCQEKFM